MLNATEDGQRHQLSIGRRRLPEFGVGIWDPVDGLRRPRAIVVSNVLGNDAADSKTTAASSWRAQGIDPKAYITGMCRESCETLAQWPAVAGAWDEYLAEDVQPVIDRFVEQFSPEYAS